MALRRETAEHPFANLKHRIFGNGRFLLRGPRGSGGEMALALLAYNFRRALNLLGGAQMRQQPPKNGRPGRNPGVLTTGHPLFLHGLQLTGFSSAHLSNDGIYRPL
jgi:hypothetical protein